MTEKWMALSPPHPPPRSVLYMVAPRVPSQEEFAASGGDVHVALLTNLERAERWLAWLRRSFPIVTIIAPWIAAARASGVAADVIEDVDAGAVIARCDGIILVVRVTPETQRPINALRNGGQVVNLAAWERVEPPPEAYDEALHGPVPPILRGERGRGAMRVIDALQLPEVLDGSKWIALSLPGGLVLPTQTLCVDMVRTSLRWCDQLDPGARPGAPNRLGGGAELSFRQLLGECTLVDPES